METNKFIVPFDKEENVNVNRKPIKRVFNQPIFLSNSGSVKLRRNSKDGEIIEEFFVGSPNLRAVGSELLIYPERNLPYETQIFLTVDDGVVVSKMSGEKCNFLSENSSTTFSFTTETAIGKTLEGGTIISENGGRYLIVSPKNAELSLPWSDREEAIAHTENITKTTGWFIPSLDLLISERLINKHLWADQKDFYWTNKNNTSINIYKNQVVNSSGINTSNKVRTFKFVVAN